MGKVWYDGLSFSNPTKKEHTLEILENDYQMALIRLQGRGSV